MNKDFSFAEVIIAVFGMFLAGLFIGVFLVNGYEKENTILKNNEIVLRQTMDEMQRTILDLTRTLDKMTKFCK